jgi:hypothetical protein
MNSKRGIFSLVLILGYVALYANDGAVSIGYVGTELGKNGANLAIDYAKKMEASLSQFKAGASSTYSFSPDIKIILGSNDAFNGIVAKYTGRVMIFQNTTIAGIETPDLSKNYHVVPLSIGVESNNNMDFVNSIVEAGYIPMLNGKQSTILQSLMLGLFIQGGYKYEILDTAGVDTQNKAITNNSIQFFPFPILLLRNATNAANKIPIALFSKHRLHSSHFFKTLSFLASFY